VLAGQIVWDEACWTWEFHVDQRPAPVVYLESSQDAVSAAVVAPMRPGVAVVGPVTSNSGKLDPHTESGAEDEQHRN
jgi:hypothetical protein